MLFPEAGSGARKLDVGRPAPDQHEAPNPGGEIEPSGLQDPQDGNTLPEASPLSACPSVTEPDGSRAGTEHPSSQPKSPLCHTTCYLPGEAWLLGS